MRIFQHICDFYEYDGIGSDVIGFDFLFQSLNFESYILCITTNVHKKNILTYPYSIKFNKDDIHILHYGGHGYPIHLFENLRGKKIIRFHNITPAYFSYRKVSDWIYEKIKLQEKKSILELVSIYKKVQLFIHDSRFNLYTLNQIISDGNLTKEILRSFDLNFIQSNHPIELLNQKNKVIPIIKKYTVRKKTKSSKYKIGYIGRIVPNKKIEDLILLLYYLKNINSNYHLEIIGSIHSIYQEYNEKIIRMVEELNLRDSILFISNIPEEEKLNRIQEFSIFVSMSEHEGFCIPILEAFSQGIPVVAFCSTAIPDTMKDAGILFKEKQLDKVAEMVELLNENIPFRNKIIEKQFEVIVGYNNYDFKKEIMEMNF